MRNKMTALALVGLAYFSVCSFTVLNNAKKLNATELNSNPKDLDVQMILKGLGVTSTIDQKALDAKYPGVKVEAKKGVNIGFNNPMAKPYSLMVFDTDGNLIASVDNIIVPTASLPANMFNKGSYIYKLAGEGNTYAGKFFYE